MLDLVLTSWYGIQFSNNVMMPSFSWIGKLFRKNIIEYLQRSTCILVSLLVLNCCLQCRSFEWKNLWKEEKRINIKNITPWLKILIKYHLASFLCSRSTFHGSHQPLVEIHQSFQWRLAPSLLCYSDPWMRKLEV